MSPLRSTVWFSFCLHLIQQSGSSTNQKDPEDDSKLQAKKAPIVHELAVPTPNVISLIHMT